MLDLDPPYVLQLIQQAEDLRKKVLANTAQLIRRYAGTWYRSDQRGRARPENMIFSFIATMLPSLVFDNPAVTVSAKRSISHRQIARYMAMGINGWIKDVDARVELELCALDMLLGFGVGMVGLEPKSDFAGSQRGVAGRFTMQALEPFFVHIPAANAIIDPECDHSNSARLQGHRFQLDLDDLKNSEIYDPRIVEKLTADDEERTGASSSERAYRDAKGNRNLRNRVTLYQLYFPEYRQIGTLALNRAGSGEWIRPLRKYHGPAKGPYVWFGCYTVPDQVYPLSPVAAMAEQDDELNAHARSAAREAATGKNLVAVSADHPEVKTAIEQAPANGIIMVKGLNGSMMMPLAVGGTTPQRVAYLQMLLERTDRIAGQSDMARGRAAGVTATESTLAEGHSDARSAFLDLKFRDSAKDVLTRVGWYMFNDPAVVMPVSDEDPMTGQPFEGIFLGGPQEGQEDMDWSGFFLDIEPMSMRRIDPAVQQQRAQMTVGLAVQIAPMILQFPYMNWQAILDMVGEANNIPDFAKVVLNSQGLMLMQQAMSPGVTPDPMAMQLLPQSASMGIRGAASGLPMGLLGGRGGASGIARPPMAGAAGPAAFAGPRGPMAGGSGQTGRRAPMAAGVG